MFALFAFWSEIKKVLGFVQEASCLFLGRVFVTLAYSLECDS
jgi:hypothetical protein